MNSLYKLTVKCPKCGCDLSDETKLIDGVPAVRLAVRARGKEGYVWLSSMYGSYDHETTLDMMDGEISTFFCPLCKEELTSRDSCNTCQAHMVDLHLFEGGKVSICSRLGCTKHSIEFEDLATAMNHFFNELEVQKPRM
jgi:predicted RNA-binding Zn-ribbon protein involved in translation (DUF1610 family)